MEAKMKGTICSFNVFPIFFAYFVTQDLHSPNGNQLLCLKAVLTCGSVLISGTMFTMLI